MPLRQQVLSFLIIAVTLLITAATAQHSTCIADAHNFSRRLICTACIAKSFGLEPSNDEEPTKNSKIILKSIASALLVHHHVIDSAPPAVINQLLSDIAIEPTPPAKDQSIRTCDIIYRLLNDCDSCCADAIYFQTPDSIDYGHIQHVDFRCERRYSKPTPNPLNRLDMAKEIFSNIESCYLLYDPTDNLQQMPRDCPVVSDDGDFQARAMKNPQLASLLALLEDKLDNGERPREELSKMAMEILSRESQTLCAKRFDEAQFQFFEFMRFADAASAIVEFNPIVFDRANPPSPDDIAFDLPYEAIPSEVTKPIRQKYLYFEDVPMSEKAPYITPLRLLRFILQSPAKGEAIRRLTDVSVKARFACGRALVSKYDLEEYVEYLEEVAPLEVDRTIAYEYKERYKNFITLTICLSEMCENATRDFSVFMLRRFRDAKSLAREFLSEDEGQYRRIMVDLSEEQRRLLFEFFGLWIHTAVRFISENLSYRCYNTSSNSPCSGVSESFLTDFVYHRVPLKISDVDDGFESVITDTFSMVVAKTAEQFNKYCGQQVDNICNLSRIPTSEASSVENVALAKRRRILDLAVKHVRLEATFKRSFESALPRDLDEAESALADELYTFEVEKFVSDLWTAYDDDGENVKAGTIFGNLKRILKDLKIRFH